MQLWRRLLEDMEQLPFLRVSAEKQQHASNILKAVSARFFVEMSWDLKVPPIMSTLGKEREEKCKQKEKDAEKTSLKPEEAKRDENYFKRQKMRQLQQEIVAEQQRRRYRRISDYSEHLDIPQGEQEEFKVNIEELLRDKEIVLDTIAEQQKQIASMMEDAKRTKEKLKIHKGREAALDIDVQKMINDAKRKEEYHERQIAVMKEEMAGLREEMRLENARRIEDHRRTEDAHQRQIAGMKEDIRRLEGKQRAQPFGCMY